MEKKEKFDKGLLENITRTARGLGWKGALTEENLGGSVGAAKVGYTKDPEKETWDVPKNYGLLDEVKRQVNAPRLLEQTDADVRIAPLKDLEAQQLKTSTQRTAAVAHELGHISGMSHGSPLLIMKEGSVNPTRASSDRAIRADVAEWTRQQLPNAERQTSDEALKGLRTPFDKVLEWLTGANKNRARPSLTEPNKP